MKRSAKSAQQLIFEAESLLDECNPEEAVPLLDSALGMEPRNTTALDLLGQVTKCNSNYNIIKIVNRYFMNILIIITIL